MFGSDHDHFWIDHVPLDTAHGYEIRIVQELMLFVQQAGKTLAGGTGQNSTD
jgi:hypothetical protein